MRNTDTQILVYTTPLRVAGMTREYTVVHKSVGMKYIYYISLANTFILYTGTLDWSTSSQVLWMVIQCNCGWNTTIRYNILCNNIMS